MEIAVILARGVIIAGMLAIGASIFVPDRYMGEGRRGVFFVGVGQVVLGAIVSGLLG